MTQTTKLDSVSISTNNDARPAYCAGCSFPILPRGWLVKVTKRDGERSFVICYPCFKAGKEPES